jgi:hypothetical protein
MTTTDTANKFRYEGNGATDTFSYPARVFATTDLVVELITRATDVLAETLTINTHYTVTIATNGTASVQVTSAPKIPSASQDILIRRAVPQSQSLALPTGTPFPAKNVETALDRVTALVQDLDEQIARAIKLPAQTSATNGLTVEPEDNLLLAWDGTTGLLQNGPSIEDFENATTAAEDAADTATAAAAAASSAASTATTQAGIASAAADAAEAAAAGVNLPALGAADTVLQVNAGGAALEYGKIATANIDDDAVTLAKLENGTQGDVLYYGASGAPTRLTAGTSGQYLQTQGAGANPAWATLAASGFANNGYASSRYYFGGIRNSSGGNFAVTANRLYFKPFVVGATATFTKVGINVTTGAGNARLGIYNMADGAPTTLVLDCGTVSTASTGEKEVTISQSLTAGVYAIAAVFDNTPNISYSSDESFSAHFVGSDSFTGSANGGGYVAHTYGALPTPFGSTTYAAVNAVPVFWIRK